MKPVLFQLRHPERSVAKSKDSDTLNLTDTVQTFQPQNRVPHLREAKVGSQSVILAEPEFLYLHLLLFFLFVILYGSALYLLSSLK
jgi:hypothetical protein